MTPARPRSRTAATTAAVIVYAAADTVLAVLGWMVWSAYRHDTVTAADASAFTLLGASAAAGAVLLAVTAAAVVRASPRTAAVCAGLSWLRLGAVVVTVVAIAAAFGAPAVVGLIETFATVLAVGEALVAAIATSLIARRNRSA